jgi:methionyl-tRNA synthetase
MIARMSDDTQTGSGGADTFYITTPIYYVNDAPHIGHCYSTIVADCAARFMRLSGRDTFFLTGTDEHAEKVVTAAAERGLTPREWADRNAEAFRRAFGFITSSHDDFIRTSEPRHIERVEGYIKRLLGSGDIFLGTYEGWFDESQEEYVTESVAREHDYASPVTGRPLVKRSEQNYFFRLSAYADRLLAHIEANPAFIQPDARRNEVLGRIRQGLQDVPVSRAAGEAESEAHRWGISMPDDEAHRVYVWIDALFNYLTTVDTDRRRKYWPAQVHVIAKDILWFHAVIWPCLLMALGEAPPRTVYVHSYYIREGRKMSKSLSNFIDLPTMEAYADRFGVDALRYYLLTHGPLGVTDADFSYTHFVEVYNAHLANGIGNAHSRVTNMIAKYFDGKVPEPPAETGGVDAELGPTWPKWRAFVAEHSAAAVAHADRVEVDKALAAAMAISNAVDGFINDTAPFKLAKDEANMPQVAAILYQCAEALRVACTLLSPAMPNTMAVAIERLGFTVDATDSFEELIEWGRLTPGKHVTKGEALFPRADAKDDEPAPAAG